MHVSARDLCFGSSGRSRVLSSLLVLVGLAVVGRGVQAQAVDNPGGTPPLQALVLKPSAVLEEQLPPEQNGKVPVFVSGDRMSGRPDLETLIEGNVELRKAGTVIHADRLEYDQPSDQVKAHGNVRINHNFRLPTQNRLTRTAEHQQALSRRAGQ